LKKFADCEGFSADINGTVILVLFTQFPVSRQEKVVNMWRKIAYAGILGLIALSFGCTMCCHPYDNNGPVYDSNGQCASDVRAGSILEGGAVQPSSADVNQGKTKETTPNVGQGLD
jgi:hypothetical protein